jgi:hypothetical protein
MRPAYPCDAHLRDLQTTGQLRELGGLRGSGGLRDPLTFTL